MPTPYVYLTAANGLEFRFSSPRTGFFMASLVSGAITISSNSIHHVIGEGAKDFTIYFENAFLDFPSSQLSQFKKFLQQVHAAKAAA